MRILRLGDRGTDVMEMQALLQKIGYNPGPIDGIFGVQTQQAVRMFQQNNGLIADGIIGPNNYAALDRFMRGYDTYRIRPGDTLFMIAARFYTTVPRIIAANPGIQPLNLQIGQVITVPYGIDVVDTNIDYTYDIMERDIAALKARYPFLQIGIAGQSVLGRNLYYIRMGMGPNRVFYNGSHHSLEWPTTPLLMKFIENFSKAYVEGVNISGYSPRDIWTQSTIDIMPMVNPDGVDLVLNGLTPDNPFYDQLLMWNGGRMNFGEVWQANVRGVDLNHNYNAKWEESVASSRRMGIVGPGPTRFPGTAPESEPESRAVANLTRANNYRLVLAYHTQGQVIFWNFDDLATEEARRIGELFAQVSGYQLAKAYGIASTGGYKDWFIKEYGRPGYTIEVGRGVNPISITQFNMIYNNNIELLLLAAVV